MTTYDWADTRAQAIDQFGGETPGAQLEQDVIGHFVDDPERVIRTITRVAGLPDIRSRWAVVRSELGRAAQANITADATRARSKTIDRAKQWIDNAGLHYDRPEQVEGELFGDEYGPGRIENADKTTRDELMAYWRNARPRGEQAERDFLAWNESCRAYHEQRLAHKVAKRQAAQPEPEPVAVAADADADIDW